MVGRAVWMMDIRRVLGGERMDDGHAQPGREPRLPRAGGRQLRELMGALFNVKGDVRCRPTSGRARRAGSGAHVARTGRSPSKTPPVTHT
jgi:hypothetical protein